MEYVGRDGLMPFRGTMSVDKPPACWDMPQNPLEGGEEICQWYRT
jgi:hypothetical protein